MSDSISMLVLRAPNYTGSAREVRAACGSITLTALAIDGLRPTLSSYADMVDSQRVQAPLWLIVVTDRSYSKDEQHRVAYEIKQAITEALEVPVDVTLKANTADSASPSLAALSADSMKGTLKQVKAEIIIERLVRDEKLTPHQTANLTGELREMVFREMLQRPDAATKERVIAFMVESGGYLDVEHNPSS